MIDIVILLISFAIILIGAKVFTNSIEWLGRKLHLGDGAVGSIFAAVGTAMPETLVPVVAILGGGRDSGGHDVGIGAILGAPFMLATLAMFVTGIAAVIKRRNNSPMLVDPGIIKRDMTFFMMVYAVAILASFLPGPEFKIVVAIALVFAYVIYAYRTIKSSMGEDNDGNELKPLFLAYKKKSPHLVLVLVQIALALCVIIGGATLFVEKIQIITIALGVPVLILSLIITPVATELPEKFNSIIWTSQGKDTLALGNISGAMVFQSSVIPAIGILLTDWVLEPLALYSAGLALVAAVFQYMGLRSKNGLRPAHLLFGGLFYSCFIVVVITGIL